uniref:Uncharacterized protein n=1 Tax=Nelumbo nucifera TaxID=4432 RepID=A0A822ZSB3_NELNU|nr:TPA_asm: hypothetical protein HUJ06_004525 [Nelumbo nucifera]
MQFQEVRDCLLGRLFAYGSLVQSGRISQGWVSNKNTPLVKEFINHVISLAAKKLYLKEPAVLDVLNLVEQVFYSHLIFMRTIMLCYL